MYVCVCAAVTENQIDSCIARGVNTLAELRREFELDSPCGRCIPLLREILESRGAPQAREPAALGRVTFAPPGQAT